MHLTPKEQDRLTLFTLAELARRRRARGRRLNVPEAIALICDEMIERAWDGAALDEVLAHGRSVLTRDDVMDGVPELVRHVEVDALFPSGTALLAVDDPIGPASPGTAAAAPGAVTPAPGPVVANVGRATVELDVVNTAALPVVVSSHYHFAEVNQALLFDRAAATGMRLDIAAGSAERWEPGQRRRVRLAALGGAGVARGFARG
jgi:urease subunit gamma/beta